MKIFISCLLLVIMLAGISSEVIRFSAAVTEVACCSEEEPQEEQSSSCGTTCLPFANCVCYCSFVPAVKLAPRNIENDFPYFAITIPFTEQADLHDIWQPPRA